MKAVPNNQLGSIIGDGNTQGATFLRDLGSVGQQDPYLGIETNSSDFNIFQKLNITDNIYDTRIEQQFPQIQQLGQTVFQFNTMGWTNLYEMAVEIPITITTTQQWSQSIPAGWSTSNGNWYTQSNTSAWMRQLMGDFCFLNPLNKFEITMGNNNQPLGRQQQFFTKGLKTCMWDHPTDRNLALYAGMCGLPEATSLFTADVIGTYTTGGVAAPQAYANAIIDAEGFMGSFSSPSNQEYLAYLQGWYRHMIDALFAGNQGNAPTTFYHRLVIPLSLLNYFFKSSAFIPPDTKFKMEFLWDTQSEVTGILPTTNVVGLPTGGPFTSTSISALGGSQKISMSYTQSNWRLVYYNHTLRQPIQAQINERWITSPFLYNYETLEMYTYTGQNNASFYIDIAVSQQRPTELIMGFYSSEPQLGNIRGGALATAAASDALAISQMFFYTSQTGGTNILGNEPFVQNVNSGGSVANVVSAYWPNSLAPHPGVQRMDVLVGGRTQYFYDTSLDPQGIVSGSETFYGKPQGNAFDYIMSEVSRKTYEKYNPGASISGENFNSFASGMIPSRFALTIAPGNLVDRANIPSDLGSHNVRINMTLKANLPASITFVVFKKMPEQIALDSNKNCTLIMWPAVKSNQGYILPTTTNVA